MYYIYNSQGHSDQGYSKILMRPTPHPPSVSFSLRSKVQGLYKLFVILVTWSVYTSSPAFASKLSESSSISSSFRTPGIKRGREDVSNLLLHCKNHQKQMSNTISAFEPNVSTRSRSSSHQFTSPDYITPPRKQHGHSAETQAHEQQHRNTHYPLLVNSFNTGLYSDSSALVDFGLGYEQKLTTGNSNYSTTTTQYLSQDHTPLTPHSYSTFASVPFPNSEERPLKRNFPGHIGPALDSQVKKYPGFLTRSDAFEFSASNKIPISSFIDDNYDDNLDTELTQVLKNPEIDPYTQFFALFSDSDPRYQHQPPMVSTSTSLTSIPQSFNLNEFDPWTTSPAKSSSEPYFKYLAQTEFALEPYQCNTLLPDAPDSKDSYESFPAFMLPLMPQNGIFAKPPRNTVDAPPPKFVLPEFSLHQDTLNATITKESSSQKSRKLKANKKSDLYPSLKEYMTKCVAKNRIRENNWIIDSFAGKFVDFDSIVVAQPATWPIERGAAFIMALIPYIKQEPHFEDILSDFLSDFFFKNIFAPNPFHKVDLRECNELIPIAESMISHLIRPTIFQSFLARTQSHFGPEHLLSIFGALAKTMKSFDVPIKKKFECKYVKPTKPDLTGLDSSQATALASKYEQEYTRWYENDKWTTEFQESYNAKRRQALILKNRSFEYLKLLVKFWSVPEEVKPDLNTSKSNNQDFSDVLYFSDVLRACMSLDDLNILIEQTLESLFYNLNNTAATMPDIGSRYLQALDRILLSTSFNFVANISSEIIHTRRYLLKYLLVKAVPLLKLNSSPLDSTKVFDHVAFLNLQNLFEAMNLYQILPAVDEAEHLNRLEIFISNREFVFDLSVIYFAYNPFKFGPVFDMLQRLLDDKVRSVQTIKAYMEIFAAVSNVSLPSIMSRKVLQFTPSSDLKAVPSQSPVSLQSYHVQYHWSMSLNLKNIFDGTEVPAHPYSLFAGRTLLARQFGLPFSFTRPLAQHSENFTWLETIDFVNFFLEKAAQSLRDDSDKDIDPQMYPVFHVVDPQAAAYRSQKLPHDEPTHPIKLFYNLVLAKALTPEQLATSPVEPEKPSLFDQYIDQTMLLDQFFANFADIPPSALYYQSELPSSCIETLALYFEKCLRAPKPPRSELEAIFPQIFPNKS